MGQTRNMLVIVDVVTINEWALRMKREVSYGIINIQPFSLIPL